MKLAPFCLGGIALAATLGPSRAFQQTPDVNSGHPSTIEDFKAGDQHREAYQRAGDVLKAREVPAGDWVADVGAGGGYYSMRLSAAVGSDGKVFAEDISDTAMGWLRRRVALFDLRNVEIV